MSITALILAGGRASRMGGADKGLQDCGGRPLIEHVLARVAPNVDRVIISANRNLDVYRRYGHPVVEDSGDEFMGPLAGIAQGLAQCETEWLWVVPCDAPRVDGGLAARLQQACIEDASAAAVPVEGSRWQPTFALLHRDLRTSLADSIADGNRAVHAWLRAAAATEVCCDGHPEWFTNLNTPEELTAFAAELTDGTAYASVNKTL